MKKILLFSTLSALLNLMVIDQVSGQACCASKASVSKSSSCMALTNQDEKSAVAATSLESPKESTQPATTAVGTPRLLVSASFLANPLTATLALLANCKAMSDDPCCVKQGCDPKDCDLTKCEPSKCSGTKN